MTPNPEAGFPPHGRGWTVVGRVQVVAQAVSPARAGMDRREVASGSPPVGFPRTGGDGPVITYPEIGSAPFPPHGRGWTVPATQFRVNGEVFPARMAMDLSGRHRRTGSKWSAAN